MPQMHHRTVKSFMQRAGRTSPNQSRTITHYSAQYPLQPDINIDLDALFQRHAPRHLEIGFGNGDTLFAMAQQNPDHDYLGIEVFRSGVAQLLSAAQTIHLTNIRVFMVDAIPLLKKQIGNQVFESINIFFADPWPKRRHHKRRMITHEFVSLLHQKLKPTGRLFLATDWQPYAQQMLKVLNQHSGFNNAAPDGGFSERPTFRPLTKFEQRGLALGYQVWDLAFIRH